MVLRLKQGYSKHMGREEQEQDRELQFEEEFPRGRADFDFYENPDEVAYLAKREAEEKLAAKDKPIKD